MGARALIALAIATSLVATASADPEAGPDAEPDAEKAQADEPRLPGDVSRDVCAVPSCGAELPGVMGGFVRSRIGRATAPFFTDAMSSVESQFTQALSFEVVGHLRLRRNWLVGGRLPMAPSLVKQPAGSYLNKRAFGNPELFTELQRRLSTPSRFGPRWGDVALRLALRGSLGLPVANTGPEGSLTANRALEISNAMEGWQFPEHYTPGVVPFTVRARLDAVRGPWIVTAVAKLPMLVRVDDAELPDEANPRPASIVPHVGLGGGYWPTRWFGVSARVVAVAQLPAPVEAPGDNVQLSFEPRFDIALLDHITIGIEYWFPLGGPLSRTLAGGISIGLYL